MKILLRVAIGLLIALLVAVTIGFMIYTHRPIYRIPSDPAQAENLKFFVLGDQGSGNFRQWQVAHAMETVAEKQGQLDFVLLMGDNFYRNHTLPGDDSVWLSKFEHVYAGTYLSTVPYYAVLGNHDHGSADHEPDSSKPSNAVMHSFAESEIEYSRKHLGSNRWRMPDYFYSADFGSFQGRPLLRIVFIDTSLAADELAREAEFIREKFRDTNNVPVWRVVVGHHPVRTYGGHRGTVDGITAVILPALRDAKVDVYLSGHDHNQQTIARDGEPFQFVNGAGGASPYAIKEYPPDLLFARSGHGFASADVAPEVFKIDYYDGAGESVSSFEIDRRCPYGLKTCLVMINKPG